MGLEQLLAHLMSEGGCSNSVITQMGASFPHGRRGEFRGGGQLQGGSKMTVTHKASSASPSEQVQFFVDFFVSTADCNGRLTSKRGGANKFHI